MWRCRRRSTSRATPQRSRSGSGGGCRRSCPADTTSTTSGTSGSTEGPASAGAAAPLVAAAFLAPQHLILRCRSGSFVHCSSMSLSQTLDSPYGNAVDPAATMDREHSTLLAGHQGIRAPAASLLPFQSSNIKGCGVVQNLTGCCRDDC